MVKAYICIFGSLTVKAAHLELVSDLTTDAFLSTQDALLPVVASQNCYGAIMVPTLSVPTRNSKLSEFLESQKVQNAVSQFCTSQKITWKFIPEKAPISVDYGNHV